MIALREIAYARSGDKGSSANIAVFGRTQDAYHWLAANLTAELVERFFKPLGVGAVVRYDAPNLEALNFVLPGVLAGGGSRSLRIDAQGKALGMALLELPVDYPGPVWAGPEAGRGTGGGP
jgi:hypothetical protein